MNEAGFWASVVRPALHHPTLGDVAWKVPAETRAGLPDVWWASREAQAQGWLELKYVPAWPARLTTPVTIDVRPDQLAHLREVITTGSASFVLLGVANDGLFFLNPLTLNPGQRLDREALVTPGPGRQVLACSTLPGTRKARREWLRACLHRLSRGG